MVTETPADDAAAKNAALRRRGRSRAIMVVLVGLVALFYAITIVKMAHH